MRFVDTNVLLYSISTAEQAKAAAAEELLGSRDLALSTQVLGEFYVQATRATKPDRITHDQASRLIESFTRFDVYAVTLEVVRAALVTKGRFDTSYWDAVIVETARGANCELVLSEDFQDGQDFDGVRVVNPFNPV